MRLQYCYLGVSIPDKLLTSMFLIAFNFFCVILVVETIWKLYDLWWSFHFAPVTLAHQYFLLLDVHDFDYHKVEITGHL